MWARYLIVSVELSRPAAFVATLFPLTLIVVALVELNLERVVFNLMGGRLEDATVNDAAYGVLFLISVVAILLFVPLGIGYAVLAIRSRRGTVAGSRP
jgi:hypothetical protein